jgi:predicted nucleic acid-binding Zn ribbon protein
MKERICLHCGEPILGRVDKKFCTDQCRNAYNNELNRVKINYVRKVNYILTKNRRILEELNPKGKRTIPGKQLRHEGFNFDYHTNVYKTKAGKVYVFCYDQGYLALENDLFMLVTKKDYVS